MWAGLRNYNTILLGLIHFFVHAHFTVICVYNHSYFKCFRLITKRCGWWGIVQTALFIEMHCFYSTHSYLLVYLNVCLLRYIIVQLIWWSIVFTALFLNNSWAWALYQQLPNLYICFKIHYFLAILVEHCFYRLTLCRALWEQHPNIYWWSIVFTALHFVEHCENSTQYGVIYYKI